MSEIAPTCMVCSGDRSCKAGDRVSRDVGGRLAAPARTLRNAG